MVTITAAYVLKLMIAAQANAPWRSTYESTASAIADAANANPLPFPGDNASAQTAAMLVATARFESAFKPDAEGDFDKRADGTRGEPNSFCLLQVGKSNFGFLGVTREQMQSDVATCVRAGLRMMHVSFTVCRGRPIEERLNQYTTGGGACVQPTHDEGGHRVRLALWLYRRVPLPTAS